MEQTKFRRRFILVLLLGLFLRIYQFGQVPADLNPDEAFAGYQAFSILHYGIDSAGYHFPVYFVAWGSGMNVLESYLMIPFMAIFGIHSWVIRLPQLLVGCLSLVVMYLLLKRLFDEKLAIWGMFILAICPWHILLCRWGLESNLAPGFLLFGLYFVVRAMENRKWLMLAAVMYGLSLYCYATIWTVVPGIILLLMAYFWYTGKLTPCREWLYSAIILFIMALPLLLFLLVNYGFINEIVTPYISIPKMPAMQDGLLSGNIVKNIKNSMLVLFTQYDGYIWNSIKPYRMFYRGGVLLAGIGGCYNLVQMIKSIRKRQYSSYAVVFIPMIPAIVLACLIEANINRLNCMHLILVIWISICIYKVCGLVANRLPQILAACVKGGIFCAGMMGVILFSRFYFTEYKELIADKFQSGYEQAAQYAASVAQDTETVYVCTYLNSNYSKILLYNEISPVVFGDTVCYTNYPDPFLHVKSFMNYEFCDTVEMQKPGVYMVDGQTALDLSEQGYNVQLFDRVGVIEYEREETNVTD